MWIQVRLMDGSKIKRIGDLSKLTEVAELRHRLIDIFDAPVDVQKLYYRGKLMIDGHTLYDYGVGLNETIQLLICNSSKDITNLATNSSGHYAHSESIYKLGDIIDVRHPEIGAWFEARITAICYNQPTPLTLPHPDMSETDNYTYFILFDWLNEPEIQVTSEYIRPRAWRKIKITDLKPKDNVLLNYNLDKPGERGFWYDGEVIAMDKTNEKLTLIADIFIGKQLLRLKNCHILFIDEVYIIEMPGTQKNYINESEFRVLPNKDIQELDCSYCMDNPQRKCKFCSCVICGDKREPEKQLLCDECNKAYHIFCLKPPLMAVPSEDDWYCPECKIDITEVVSAGEKLKASKIKIKTASTQSSSNRDWGKGMACVGRTKICTIVPQNHFGPVPGVEVGSLWKFRVQVSESGVHRPHVAGIHGREKEGAYSIVLAGGYEDDMDDGFEFTYTGSGGRDLSGNKRTAEQSCDQDLTRMNCALARNCAVPLDCNKGGDAGELWMRGKPVRVLRSYKGAKHSIFAPQDGIRYDGTYKVVKYWKEPGKSGFLVWRYLLRRDDPVPAPWTVEGKLRITQLGITIKYPEGYIIDCIDDELPTNLCEEFEMKQVNSCQINDDSSVNDKISKATTNYRIDSKLIKLIKKDVNNKKIWKEILHLTYHTSQEFLTKLEEIFKCICCQEIIYQPVSLPCSHNMCLSCMSRSFLAEIYSCPLCRRELGKCYKMTVNESLRDILLMAFPGYEGGR